MGFSNDDAATMLTKASEPKLVQPLRWAYAVSCNENPVLPRNRRRGSEKTRGTHQSIWSDISRTDVVKSDVCRTVHLNP